MIWFISNRLCRFIDYRILCTVFGVQSELVLVLPVPSCFSSFVYLLIIHVPAHTPNNRLLQISDPPIPSDSDRLGRGPVLDNSICEEPYLLPDTFVPFLPKRDCVLSGWKGHEGVTQPRQIHNDGGVRVSRHSWACQAVDVHGMTSLQMTFWPTFLGIEYRDRCHLV